MPKYDYHCSHCGDFECTQSIKDTPLQQCPTCGSDVHRKISSGVGIIFKGSGFYINDSRKEDSSSSSDEQAS